MAGYEGKGCHTAIGPHSPTGLKPMANGPALESDLHLYVWAGLEGFWARNHPSDDLALRRIRGGDSIQDRAKDDRPTRRTVLWRQTGKEAGIPSPHHPIRGPQPIMDQWEPHCRCQSSHSALSDPKGLGRSQTQCSPEQVLGPRWKQEGDGSGHCPQLIPVALDALAAIKLTLFPKGP